MTLPPWHEEPVSKSLDRESFDCGEAAMNDFLRRHARKAHEQNASKTFCAVDDDHFGHILGFYTVTPSAVARDELPMTFSRGLAKHEVSGFKLARIAIDVAVAGRGLGGKLLAAAALRCSRAAADVGGILLIIDAKDAKASNWYASYGAEPLVSRPLTLVVPLAVFVDGFRSKKLL